MSISVDDIVEGMVESAITSFEMIGIFRPTLYAFTTLGIGVFSLSDALEADKIAKQCEGPIFASLIIMPVKDDSRCYILSVVHNEHEDEHKMKLTEVIPDSKKVVDLGDWIDYEDRGFGEFSIPLKGDVDEDRDINLPYQ